MILGLALAGSIVLYDAWHKGNVFAPVIMGLCRALVYLVTGAAVSGEIRFAFDSRGDGACHPCHWADLRGKAGEPESGRPALAACHSGRPSAVGRAGHLERMACRCQLPVVGARPISLPCACWHKRAAPDAVPRAVSMLIAAICLVDALAVVLYGGGILLACICASGYLLTRLFQTVIPGT